MIRTAAAIAVLASLLTGSGSDAPLTMGSGTTVHEFGAKDEDPDPLIVPEVGTPLRLDDLGIPIALRNLEE